MRVLSRFLLAATDERHFPPPSLPEIAVVGRSNVGKSSLINALVGQPGLARTSRTPGRTRLINWFEVDARFLLVDLPGYGYAEVSQAMREGWRPLIEGYLAERETLAGVLLPGDHLLAVGNLYHPTLDPSDTAVSATVARMPAAVVETWSLTLCGGSPPKTVTTLSSWSTPHGEASGRSAMQ